MKNIKKISIENMNEFSQKIEYAKDNFIPMLPFVKMPFHDFDRYKSYSDKGIFLIDYLTDGYCLYHLYHLSEGDDTLRATLILPSDWNNRFEIIEKSISNIKEWFLTEDSSKRFIIQSLEYGEVEYFPTLSHYLIPTIVRNGFAPVYRMYMKRQAGLPENQGNSLKEGLVQTDYSEELLEDIVKFYFKNEGVQNPKYFSNCTYEEFTHMIKQEFTRKNSRFIKNKNGEIVAGIISSIDAGKTWIDNFTVHPEYDGIEIAEYLLWDLTKRLSEEQPEENIYIYLNRECRNAIIACEKNGFTPFEFWVDMILEK